MTIRRLLANLLLALAILALLEGACRLGESGSKYRPSASLGYELQPGYSGRREHVNSDGVRGDELGPRAPGTLCILAMGGSTTWGHKVADDETWPACLQRRLRRDGRSGAVVINGGVSGWGLQQVVLALRERLERFRPDLVLVYCGWNWPVLEGNPQVERFRRVAASAEHADWLHRSALVRWLDRKLSSFTARPAPSPAAARAGTNAGDAADADAADTPFAGRNGMHAVMEQSFPLLYAELTALCRQRGVKLAIVRYPALAQLPLPADPALRDRYEDALRTEHTASVPLPELDQAARDEYRSALAVIDAAAPAAGIPELDVAGRLFADHAAPAAWLDLFRDRMHLTPAGDAALADALAALLAEQGLLPER